uniref:Uncharacterized protein n=1 Tax=Sphaerodactylus townsendi TaxID=933632 RepID=A0ACB8FUD2_9SAUR
MITGHMVFVMEDKAIIWLKVQAKQASDFKFQTMPEDRARIFVNKHYRVSAQAQRPPQFHSKHQVVLFYIKRCTAKAVRLVSSFFTSKITISAFYHIKAE